MVEGEEEGEEKEVFAYLCGGLVEGGGYVGGCGEEYGLTFGGYVGGGGEEVGSIVLLIGYCC